VGSFRAVGKLHSGLPGELFDCLAEALMLVLHEETDGAAMGAAAEAMVELLLATDSKGGGLLVVKGAACLIVLSRLAQVDAVVDEFDDVGASEQVVDEIGGNPAGHGLKLAEARERGR